MYPTFFFAFFQFVSEPNAVIMRSVPLGDEFFRKKETEKQ
ncbi:hypothetical protein Z950_2309 [Sulfitobacter mediterraneus KCTC 32188]|nr:hypothetical protein Z950_2309 [Sulfitobacter mediterraneus KCTC 32188]